LASSRTEDEVRAEYAEKMGPELGELQYLLWHDVTTLHLQWSEFRELFATKPSRIQLMNETAPRFFGRLEARLWNDVFLHLCRLPDHPGGPGQERVTVLRYKPLVMGLPIQAAVHAAVDSAVSATLCAGLAQSPHRPPGFPARTGPRRHTAGAREQDKRGSGPESHPRPNADTGGVLLRRAGCVRGHD
jgi:HEPN superfamily AbiU2-like protein